MQLYKLSILYFIFLFSCTPVSEEEKPAKTKVARVGESHLYFEDFKENLPHFQSKNDSIEFLNFYIQNWIKNEVMIAKSKENLGERIIQIDQKVNQYKQSLLIHSFEQEFIKQKLDTTVSEKEVKSYYEENLNNFQLKDLIVKALYFKIPESSKLNKKASTWYKLYKYDDDLDELYKKVSLKTDLFYYDTTQWAYLKDIKSIIPINYSNNVAFLKSKKHYSITENGYTYYLNIIDYKLNDAISPLSLVTAKIKNIIINQRREKIRKELRLNLFEHAKKTGQIETY